MGHGQLDAYCMRRMGGHQLIKVPLWLGQEVLLSSRPLTTTTLTTQSVVVNHRFVWNMTPSSTSCGQTHTQEVVPWSN